MGINLASQFADVPRKQTVSADLVISKPTTESYEALRRVSETLSDYRKADDLVKIVAQELGGFLPFDHLDVIVFRENCNLIEAAGFRGGNCHFLHNAARIVSSEGGR